MSLAVLFAPLVLAQSAAPARSEEVLPPSVSVERWQGGELAAVSAFDPAGETFRVPSANQVRIEQHSTIRVAPRAAPRALPRRPSTIVPRPWPGEPQLVERRMGRCIPIDRLAGVQVETGNRLMLYLRDRRVIRAELERNCRARDFYSGFYLSASEDGKLCVGRDTLLSRSGANCKLTRIRQLVEED